MPASVDEPGAAGGTAVTDATAVNGSRVPHYSPDRRGWWGTHNMSLARIMHAFHQQQRVEEHKVIDCHDLCRSKMTKQRKQTALAGITFLRE